MPIYLPWLTVAIAIISLLAAATAYCEYFWIFPLYLSLFMALLALYFFKVITLPRAILFLIFIPLPVFIYTNHLLPKATSNDLSFYNNKPVIFKAVFLEKLQQNEYSKIYTATILPSELIYPDQKFLSGKVKLTINATDQNFVDQFQEGQLVEITGKIQKISPRQEPWLANLNNNFKRKGIFSQIFVDIKKIKIINTKSFMHPKNNIGQRINSHLDQIRHNITNLHIRYLGEKAGSLLSSMVLGDRAVALNKDILESFRKIGLSHIVAASGFNLTIVTFITYWFLRKLFTNRLLITFMVSINVILYALLAGLSASIIRAALACLLVLFVRLFYRRLNALSTIATVLIINLTLDPSFIIDVGAQLSYAAVIGIIMGAAPLTKIFSFNNEHKIIKIFASSLAVILLAQMTVLPIQLYHFWQTSFLFLPANLLIDPLVSPLTIIGFISSAVGAICSGAFVPGLLICNFLDLLAFFPLKIIIYITEAFSSFNGTLINIGQPPVLSIIFYCISLAVFLVSLTKQKHRAVCLMILAVALSVLLYKADLKQPTLIFLPHSIIAINKQRQAVCFGIPNPQTNKIVSYYGSSYLSQQCNTNETILFQLSTNPKITINTSDQTLSASADNDNQEHLVSTKTYLIANRNKSSLQLQKVCFLKRLSPAELGEELKDIDIKTYCTQKNISIMLLQ
jgi:competence protein ComEC